MGCQVTPLPLFLKKQNWLTPVPLKSLVLQCSSPCVPAGNDLFRNLRIFSVTWLCPVSGIKSFVTVRVDPYTMSACDAFKSSFVCNRGDSFMSQDGLRMRKLCQSPMPDHCCNSGIIRGASPRCFPYTITWTPEEESTCNAGHGIGTWSAERHWEADPTTAGRGHF